MAQKFEQSSHELAKERSLKDREVDFAHLQAERDKLAMKSAYEVRLEAMKRDKDELMDAVEGLKGKL